MTTTEAGWWYAVVNVKCYQNIGRGTVGEKLHSPCNEMKRGSVFLNEFFHFLNCHSKFQVSFLILLAQDSTSSDLKAARAFQFQCAIAAVCLCLEINVSKLARQSVCSGSNMHLTLHFFQFIQLWWLLNHFTLFSYKSSCTTAIMSFLTHFPTETISSQCAINSSI